MITVGPTDDTQTCFAVRNTVFVHEQGYTAEGEVDALDATSHHILGLDGTAPVATARVHIDREIAKIGRVCVIASYRGRGLGVRLIEAAVTIAAAQGATRVVLGAQAHATKFYEKLGFAAYGPRYDDEGEPHQMMARAL